MGKTSLVRVDPFLKQTVILRFFCIRKKINAGPWRTSSMAVLECSEPSKKFTTYLHGCGAAAGLGFFDHQMACALDDIHLMSLRFKALNAA